jgi:hypothetical protein
MTRARLASTRPSPNAGSRAAQNDAASPVIEAHRFGVRGRLSRLPRRSNSRHEIRLLMACTTAARAVRGHQRRFEPLAPSRIARIWTARTESPDFRGFSAAHAITSGGQTRVKTTVDTSTMA